MCEGRSHDVIRKCPDCDFSSSKKFDFIKHLKEAHLSKYDGKEESSKYNILYKCKEKECDFSSTYVCSIKRHTKNHSQNSEPCYICGEVPKTKQALEVHIRSHAKTKCDKCLKFFPNEAFNDHLCEKNQFVCVTCGEGFLSKTRLSTHVRVIHEKRELPKNFICDQCHFQCTDKYALQKHMKTHEEKKACPECGLKVRNMKFHMKSSHTSDEMKKFRCQDCGKGFISGKQLENHRMNVHLKLRPHHCRYGCSFSYNDSSNRNQHEKKTHGKLFTTVKE